MNRDNLAKIGILLLFVGAFWGAWAFLKKQPKQKPFFAVAAGVLMLLWATRPGEDRADLERWTLKTLHDGGVWWVGAQILATLMGGREVLEVAEDVREAAAAAAAAPPPPLTDTLTPPPPNTTPANTTPANTTPANTTPGPSTVLPYLITQPIVYDPQQTTPTIVAPDWVTQPYTASNLTTADPSSIFQQQKQLYDAAQRVARLEASLQAFAQQVQQAQTAEQYAQAYQQQQQRYQQPQQYYPQKQEYAPPLAPAPQLTPTSPKANYKNSHNGMTPEEWAKAYTLAQPQFSGQTPAASTVRG